MKINRILSVLFAIVLCFSFPLTACAQEPTLDVDNSELSETSAESRKVSYDNDFSIGVGDTFSKSFNMSVLLGDDHNMFSVVIDDLSSNPAYVVTIESDESGADPFVTPTKYAAYTVKRPGKSGITYNLTIMNVGTSTLTGNLKISSFYA